MSLDMHTVSVPILLRMLRNLSAWLDSAQAFAQARGLDEKALLAARLYPDMLPLSRQVQIASDHAKSSAARLTGHEPPVFEDTEADLSALRERIARTLAYVESIDRGAWAGAIEREIRVPVRGAEPMLMNGLEYWQHYGLPNFFFHVTTSYAILRHLGVALGKVDYLRGTQRST